jgi:hypothetical protein
VRGKKKKKNNAELPSSELDAVAPGVLCRCINFNDVGIYARRLEQAVLRTIW